MKILFTDLKHYIYSRFPLHSMTMSEGKEVGMGNECLGNNEITET